MHVNLVLDILHLVGRIQKLRVRRNDRAARIRKRPAPSARPLRVRGATGNIIADCNVLLAAVHLGQIGAHGEQDQVVHRNIVVHAEIHQILRRLRLQMECRDPQRAVLHLHIRCPKRLVAMRLAALLQDRRTLHVRIDRLSLLFEHRPPEFFILFLPLLIGRLFQVLLQDIHKGRQGLRIGRTKPVMAVNLHRVVDIDDQPRRIRQPVVDVDIGTIVPLRQSHHDKFHHRDIRTDKLLVGHLLQARVCLL